MYLMAVEAHEEIFMVPLLFNLFWWSKTLCIEMHELTMSSLGHKLALDVLDNHQLCLQYKLDSWMFGESLQQNWKRNLNSDQPGVSHINSKRSIAKSPIM